MLSIPPEIWPERVKADRANPQHFYKGRTYTFDELLALRRQEGIAELIRPEVCRDRHMQCQRAISKLADLFDEKRPDVAVVVGNDQMEVFTSEHVPAFAIFWGQYVEGIPRTPEFLAKLPPGIACAEQDRTPSVYTQYPCQPELGRHLIERAMADGFDVSQLTRLKAFDHEVLEAVRKGDLATLSRVPDEMFRAGTSEIKNWITVAGVMFEAGLTMKLVDYVACYRSEAGTGSAMGFAHWR